MLRKVKPLAFIIFRNAEPDHHIDNFQNDERTHDGYRPSNRNADQPDLSINPLSVLTPGILRRIFEGKMPTAAQAPSNAPPGPVAITPRAISPQTPAQGAPAPKVQ